MSARTGLRFNDTTARYRVDLALSPGSPAPCGGTAGGFVPPVGPPTLPHIFELGKILPRSTHVDVMSMGSPQHMAVVYFTVRSGSCKLRLRATPHGMPPAL